MTSPAVSVEALPPLPQPSVSTGFWGPTEKARLLAWGQACYRLGSMQPAEPPASAEVAITDEQRIDWYEANPHTVQFGKGYRGKPDAWFYSDPNDGWLAKTPSFRLAVDLALAAAKKEPQP